jgi:penicillin G amidase
MNRYAEYYFFFFLLLLGFSSLSLKSDSKKGLVNYTGEIYIDKLKENVTVFRDQRGMPHIYASNKHDLYFATGFVTAQERLWQMDLIRRSGAGRLSEIFGKKFIETDKFFRCLGICEKSRKVIENEDPEIRRFLQDYIDGVNFYILKAGKNLPPEFMILNYKPDLWSMEDIASIIGLIGWNLADHSLDIELFYNKALANLGYEVTAGLFPDNSGTENVVHPDFVTDRGIIDDASSFAVTGKKMKSLGLIGLSASNNWVVSGKKSATGKPLFSNDMHLTITSPGIWMQMHQVVPGELNVTGVLFAGEPFIVAGHNEKIAWGMTNMFVDAIDLYREKINPDNPNQYFFNGNWKDMSIRKERISIRGGAVDTFIIKFTHRGPIISGFKNTGEDAISMKWSGFDESNEIKAVSLLNNASDWKDFKSALGNFRTINQNFAYADTNGNIGMFSGGGIPLRKNTGLLIRDGTTDEYDWKGYLPSNMQPITYNPGKGYVSSANNKVVENNYPYYISSVYIAPYRINRISELLDQKDILNIDDFKRIINDQYSGCAKHFVPYILDLKKHSSELTQQEAEVLTLFSNWDYDMNKELICPSIFEYFRISLLKNILGDELGDLYGELPAIIADNYLYYLADKGNDGFVDNKMTEKVESFDDVVLKSFKDCIKEMEHNYGKNINRWTWGDIHTLTVIHPLGTSKILNFFYRFNSEKYPVGGGDNTINMFRSLHQGFKVDAGPSVKNIFNPADWDDSYTILPTGESGIPKSEFYLSQTKTFLEGSLYKDAFSDDAVRRAAKYELVLKAGKHNQ